MIISTTVQNGSFVQSGENTYFVPKSLPPDIDMSELIPLISEASNLVGTLSALGSTLQNPHLLIKPQLLREAVLSSKIEGTQVSLSDMYHYQLGAPSTSNIPDSEEVTNYVDALEMALNSIRNKDTVLNLDLIKRCHEMLLFNVRGNESSKGDFRKVQNWIVSQRGTINEVKYTPPPPELINDLMLNLMQFMDSPPRNFIPLIQCAIIHYQFEAIHPFEDGNGRIGRLLIPILLADRNLLAQPLLYVSAYIEKNKEHYYQLLANVSEKNEWIPWIRFFLLAVIAQATFSINLIQKMESLRKKYKETIPGKRSSASMLKLVDLIFEMPILSRPAIRDRLGASELFAKSAVEKLMESGVLIYAGVFNGKKIYVAEELYNLINNYE